MAKKKITLLPATALGVSAIIGSGWLFAPYKAATIAGPAALFSWIIGASLVGFLALCFAEIAALYPRRGLSAIVPTLSHNKFFGFPFAVANWLGVVAVIPLEATASVQYLINLVPSLRDYFFMNAALTPLGTSISVLLVIVFTLVNYWGAKTLIKTNNIFAIIKVVIPVITVLCILAVSFHPTNLTLYGDTMIPYGVRSVFTAILSSGIIVAFNGFQTVVAFSSEISKPHKTIPLALIYSVVFCLIIYLMLQFSFTVGMKPDLVSQGWQSIKMSAPIVQLTIMLGLGVLTSIIYIGAIVAPSGTAIALLGTSSRMFTAMARNKQVPIYFDNKDPVVGISRRSLIFNMFLAIIFLLLFKSWSTLAIILSLLHIMAYLPIPIALCVFRKRIKPKRYSFLLPCGRLISFILFVSFTCLFSMADIRTMELLLSMIAAFQFVFIALNTRSWADLKAAVSQTGFLFVYFTLLYAVKDISFLYPSGVINYYHIIIVVMIAILSFFVFIRQSRNDVDLLHSAATIYK